MASGKREVAGSRLKKNPGIIEKIEELMKYETADDPMGGLKWTRKTTAKIAEKLGSVGIELSKTTMDSIFF